MKRLSLPLIMLLCLNILLAQQPEGTEDLRMAPRANVITYDRESDIEHLKYDISPYLSQLDADWSRSEADGHVVLEQSFLVPRDWKDFLVFFRMQAPAGYALMVNGTQIGISHDGAAITEFDITRQVRPGKNLSLSLQYVGSEGALLESFAPPTFLVPQDCALLLKPLQNVQDYTIFTSYQPQSHSGEYAIDVELSKVKKKGRCYLEVELWDPKGHQVDKIGKWCFADKNNATTQTISSSLSQVEPWSAESPRLYTAVIRLFNDKMELQDVVGTRFGFRSIDGRSRLSLNGKPLTIKGITLQPQHLNPSYASTDIKLMRNQMVQMKCNNINAIRYGGSNPPSERFLELCDELGFYVICDAYLSPTSNMGQAVAADNEYSDLFADRVRNLYGRFKNHPSIIAWSLGDSPDNGVCMQSAYHALRQVDSQRPVLYSGAQYSDNTDLITPLRCNTDFLSQYISKQQERSLVMLSWGGTQGNTFGGATSLWQKVLDHQSIQGGFFDAQDWHQLSDRPYLPELKQLYRPIDVRLTSVSADAAEFLITNLCDFNTLAEYRLEYVICTNLKPDVVSGDVPMALKPGESHEFKLMVPQLTLYAGEELSIRFVLRQRNNTPTVPKNTVLSSAQFVLPSTNVGNYPYSDPLGSPFNIEKDSVHQVTISNNLCTLIFNDSLGVVTSFKYHGTEYLAESPRLNFMRPPSENDMADPNANRQWQRYDPKQMACEVVATNCRAINSHAVGIDVMLRYTSPKFGVLFDVRQTYMLLSSSDLIIHNDITVSEQIKSMARVGMQLGIPHQLTQTEWLGRNIESYCDRNSAGLIAQQRAEIDKLQYHYTSHPQHESNYAETRWVAFQNNEQGLYLDIIDTLCNFSINEFDDNSKLHATNDSLDHWQVNIDYAMSGVGSAASGINLADRDLVKGHKFDFSLHLRPFLRIDNNAQDFRRIIYPKAVSNITEMPVIRKNKDRFDGPMQVTLTCPTSKATIRYTLDGTVPTEQSPLYTKPITLQNSVVVKARAFKAGEAPSFVATEQFTFDYVIDCQFSHKPNTPYNRNAARALSDGEIGDVNDLSRGWLGFSGHDIQIDLQLGKAINMTNVELRFAHVPDAWVFAPAEVLVAVSSDGKEYTDYVPATINYDATSEEMNTTQIQIINIPFAHEQVQYVRIMAMPIRRIPAWHRAKGLKPWIMMDEIVIKEEIIK